MKKTEQVSAGEFDFTYQEVLLMYKTRKQFEKNQFSDVWRKAFMYNAFMNGSKFPMWFDEMRASGKRILNENYTSVYQEVAKKFAPSLMLDTLCANEDHPELW